MAAHNELGRWGEDVVVQYLESYGFKILHRNWFYHHKEVDVIALHESLLLFIEVKTRRSDDYGGPEQAVDWRKQRNLRQAMNAYLKQNPMEVTTRFDVYTVVGTPENYGIRIIKDVINVMISC